MLIVGIAGGTGSGKTTVVKKIEAKISKNLITIIPQDSYYKDSSNIIFSERQNINFDHPDSIEWPLLINHIKALKENKTIEQPIYSYLTCTRSKETIAITPTEVIIIEGILIFCIKELMDLMDIKVFVDTDPDDRLSRVIQRDIVERGRSIKDVLERYDKVLKPMHQQFIEPTKRCADIIVPQGGNNNVAIDMITKFIKQNINYK